MRGLTLLKKILYSSWFLAMVPAIIVSMILPPLGSKYTIDLEITRDKTVQNVYADLNSDSVSERIYVVKNPLYSFVGIKNIDDKMYDQWNLKDSIHNDISGVFTGNYDRDRFSEIFIFTNKKDSLFLNLYEALDPGGVKKDRIFITKIGNIHDQVSSVIYPIGFFDEDGDGFEELYFVITSSFRTGPRKIFSYNIAGNKLKAGATICSVPMCTKMNDADNDGKPEFFGITSGSGNYLASEPYSDSSSWFMIFNEKLEFEFPPEEFPGFAGSVQAETFNGNYVVFYWRGGADTTLPDSRIMLYAADGKMVTQSQLSGINLSSQYIEYVFRHPQSDRLILLGDKMVELNGLFQIVNEKESPFNAPYSVFPCDINNDGNKEIMLYSDNSGKLAIFNEDLQLLVNVDLQTPSPYWVISNVFQGDGKHKVFIKSGAEGFFLEMKPNRLFIPRYLTFPAIYILFFLFILLIRQINTLQIVHREHLKQRLLTLQLQGIKLQLDPHFTFNALNTVASLIYLQDSKAAYDYMNQFTRLLRSLVNDAERIYRYLDEELDFVTTYLELEKLRFGEKFEYTIEVKEGLTKKEQVPKLVLHTFAENAVKHGIMTRAEGGRLRIVIEKDGADIKLTIEDNGIGRDKSADKETTTGKGLHLTSEFYDILNELNRKPIRYKITDLHDDSGGQAGTKVEVWVPQNLN